jgi:hypothetical protein
LPNGACENFLLDNRKIIDISVCKWTFQFLLGNPGMNSWNNRPGVTRKGGQDAANKGSGKKDFVGVN